MKIYTEKMTPQFIRSSVSNLLSQDASRKVAAVSASNPDSLKLEYLERGNCPYKDMPPQLLTNETNSYVNELKGKSAMVITGAGDLIIDLIVNGYEKIVAIDINRIQIFVSILKFQSIKKLEFAEFRKFWDAGKGCFEFDIIKKILDEDDDIYKQTFEFWKAIFERYGYSSREVRYHCILGECNFINHGSSRTTIPEYAKTAEAYNKARKTINNPVEIKLIIADAETYIPADMFDTIHLSNIFNFMQPYDYIRIVERLRKYLNPKGKIITYIIQFDKDWIIHDEIKVDPYLLNWNPLTMVCLRQHYYQTNTIYNALKKYRIRFISVPTGKGYSAFYTTNKDWVMMIG